MGMEIERKFLTASDSWRHGATGIPYAQGYLCRGTGRTVRVRVAGEKAFITIKGPVQGISRAEFEYPIPVSDAQELFALCEKPVIQKVRFTIFDEGHFWEIDEFEGENSGLIVAEIELISEEASFSLPSWVGREVTGDPRFYNSNLIVSPFCSWKGELE